MLVKHDFSMTRRDFIRQVLATAGGLALGNNLGWAAAPRDRLIVAMSIGVDSLNP